MIGQARAKLTNDEVVDIFRCRRYTTAAAEVSKGYGVSEKAVRDIWTGRTWSRVTCHLDTSRPAHFKTLGRPIGSKDTKPRKHANALTRPFPCDQRAEINQESGSKASPYPSQMSAHEHLRLHQKSIDELLYYIYEQRELDLDCEFRDPFGRDWAKLRRGLDQQGC